MNRIYNFSAGPAILPDDVLLEAQSELLDYQGSGMSIMEMSHRGKYYDAVHQEALANFRELLDVPEDYAILFLQGGATLQFAQVAMNLRPEGGVADYINAGAWGKKAIAEAKILGDTHVSADCGSEIPTRQATQEELKLTPICIAAPTKPSPEPRLKFSPNPMRHWYVICLRISCPVVSIFLISV
jgi:phosphoserine aminotransferase